MTIFDNITNRLQQSENNIKHLTLNTKHLTLDTNTLNLPNEGELSDMTPTAGSGLASLPRPLGSPGRGQVVGEVIPALVNSDFQYIAVSLKTQTKEDRLEVNIDFKLQTGKQFNKLVFNLVGWNRRREFFANIEEIKDWRGYQQAYASQTKTDFIGKGRPRMKQQKKGSIQRSPIREETAMMVTTEGQLLCHLWIEDAHFILPFESWSDYKQIFCAKAEYINNPNSTRIKRGGWL